MSDVRPLTAENVEDAKSVIASRFSKDAFGVLKRVMSNPLLKECQEAGDIVYGEGKPICFRAGILRNLYLGRTKVRGRVRGLTCIRKDARSEAIIDIQMAERKNKRGCSIAYSNTQCEETEKMARIMKYKLGPESCTRFLRRMINPVKCAIYFFRRTILRLDPPKAKRFCTLVSRGFSIRDGGLELRRFVEISSAFDVFFQEYLRENKGLVSSRTSEELNWIFGGRLASGESVGVMATEGGRLLGYIFLSGGVSARRWRIMDLIALHDDTKVLAALIKAAIKFLRRNTPAMLFETTGFPMWMQPVLKRYFPLVHQVGNNLCSYNYPDKDFGVECDKVILTDKSWFFGPYDGDWCLCWEYGA